MNLEGSKRRNPLLRERYGNLDYIILIHIFGKLCIILHGEQIYLYLLHPSYLFRNNQFNFWRSLFFTLSHFSHA